MKTLKFLLVFTLLTTLVISCKGDDDSKVIEPETQVLTTLDYSNFKPEEVPDLVFANDPSGKLIASVTPDGIPGIYELISQETVSTLYKLSVFRDGELNTYEEVPKGITIQSLKKIPEYDSEVMIQITSFPELSTEQEIAIYGLENEEPELTLGKTTKISVTYDHTLSNDKVLLVISYKPFLQDEKVFRYYGINNINEQPEFILDFSELLIPDYITPVTPLPDGTDIAVIGEINGIINNHKYRLNATAAKNDFMHIASGFDSYDYVYLRSYNSQKFIHQKRTETSIFPEKADHQKPEWNFSYSVSNNKITISSTGNYTIAKIETQPALIDEKSWNWYFPPGSDQEVSIPELPVSIASIFSDYFSNTDEFYIHKVDLHTHTKYNNHEVYLTALLNNLVENGDETLSITLKPNPSN